MCLLLENKAFQLAIYFLEALEHKNRVYSFQGNTTLYEKYMNAIFDYQFYRRYILKYLELTSAVSFENEFFTILLRLFLNMEYLFGHLSGRTY